MFGHNFEVRRGDFEASRRANVGSLWSTSKDVSIGLILFDITRFLNSFKIVPHQRIISWSPIVQDHKVSKLAPDCSTSNVLEVVNTQLAKLFNITRFRI